MKVTTAEVPKKKKKKAAPPLTAKTMAEMRKRGYLVEKVEQTIPKSFIKRDLFGCIDVIGICGPVTLAVQATSYSNISARVKKIQVEKADELARMMAAGWKVEVWGWMLRPLRKGSKAMRWSYRVVECEPDHTLVDAYLKCIDSIIVDT